MDRGNLKILFLCSGNYYRSRFAAGFFNHMAKQNSLNWQASSRGLMVYESDNIGPISPQTVARFALWGIDLPDDIPFPQQVNEDDLDSAEWVVALNESEHRPMMQQLHPNWVNLIDYWHVYDLDKTSAEEAFSQLEIQLRALANKLSEGDLALDASGI